MTCRRSAPGSWSSSREGMTYREPERGMAGSGSASSAWAPLRTGAFRTLWIAALVSNAGEWMQTVGAQ
jgi:hypothetical protein